MTKLILGTLVLAIFSTSSHAQQSRKVHFRTLCLEQVADLGKVVIPAVEDPAEDENVVVYLDVSPVVTGFFKTPEAIFYNVKHGSDGKPLRVAVGKATLGKSKRQLFLFVPSGGGEGELPYPVHAYDDDLKSFALGSVRAINLASGPVRFVMPGATLPAIPPNGEARFPHSKTVDEYNMYPVAVEFQSAGGEWLKG